MFSFACTISQSDYRAMSMVLITIPGDTKREFANMLYEATHGSLKLVIIQKPKQETLYRRAVRFYRRVTWCMFEEIWYAILLRMNRRVRSALEYFRANTVRNTSQTYNAPIMEVESVNSDEVYAALARLSPDLIVVWGSAILETRILATAPQAINLHLGYCPHYRGALANQHAVLRGDFSKIGATIHYINEKPDAGDVISVIPADITKRPKELFCALNDRAIATYVAIAADLHMGKRPTAQPQDVSQGKNFLLKSWTPKMRYELGKKVLAWEARSANNETRYC